jgi:hypothetical protein
MQVEDAPERWELRKLWRGGSAGEADQLLPATVTAPTKTHKKSSQVKEIRKK